MNKIYGNIVQGARRVGQSETPIKAPSRQALNVLDSECRLLGTNRERVAAAIDELKTSVRWAFLEGQSKRAEEIRAAVNAHLSKLRRRSEKAVAA